MSHPILRGTTLAAALVAAFGATSVSAAPAAPVQAGFQVVGSSWSVTAGNLLDKNEIDVQTNSQGEGVGTLQELVDRGETINTISISTAGGTNAEDASWQSRLEAGKSITVNGSTGSWEGKLFLRQNAKNISESADDRTITVNLENSTLTGISIDNGVFLGKSKEDVNHAVSDKRVLNFKAVTIKGDITQQDASFFKNGKGQSYAEGENFVYGGETWYLDRLQTNENAITLADGSSWTGDLVTTSEFDVENHNVITLDGSTWTGRALDNKDNTELTLKNASVWTVTKAGESAVALLADEDKDIVEKITSDKTSEIVMQEGAAVQAGETNGDVRIRFLSVADGKGTSFTTGAANGTTTLIADGSLNDGSVTATDLAEKMATLYTNATPDGEKKAWEVQSGLIADGATGVYGKDGVTITGSTRNNNLVVISETAAVAMMQWRAEADDMRDRMSDLRMREAEGGVWAAAYGGKSEATKVDNEYTGFRLGSDRKVAAPAGEAWVGGALNYTKGDASFSTGSGDNHVLGLTAYGTWFSETGVYVDLSAKYGRLESDFDIRSAAGKLSGSWDANAVAASIEAGHHLDVPGFSGLLFVEPQVAFTASHVSGETFGAGNGVTVDQDSINSYVARIGVAAGVNCPNNMGTVRVKASYLHDFDGETSTLARKGVIRNRFDQDFGGDWYELGVGASFNLARNLTARADFEYECGGEIDTPYRWTVGMKWAY